MVPQDPAGLFHAMGGMVKATARLRGFLRELNGGPGGTHTDHALLGNEPTLHVPWLFDWARKPYLTQATVRRGLRLFSTAPDGYPGNDDLGTLSAWYVFGALGLYPEVPGVGLLAISSPLFRRVVVALPHRRRLTISATASAVEGRGKRKRRAPIAVARAPYIQGLRVNGRPASQPWTTYCALSHGATLTYQLGQHADRRWGSSARSVPPSFGPGGPMPKHACTP
jgi:putative alpha-1,2-mannosidase